MHLQSSFCSCQSAPQAHWSFLSPSSRDLFPALKICFVIGVSSTNSGSGDQCMLIRASLVSALLSGVYAVQRQVLYPWHLFCTLGTCLSTWLNKFVELD